MNAYVKAQKAYSSVSAPIRTPRGTEYEAVARVTRKLQAARNAGTGEFARLAEAVHLNRKMWNIFAVDVADPRNALPRELKARILYLAQFTNLHSSAVLSRSADVADLIDVNTAIMRGLRGESL